MDKDALYMVVEMKKTSFEFDRIHTADTLDGAIELISRYTIGGNRLYIIFGYPSYHIVWTSRQGGIQ